MSRKQGRPKMGHEPLTRDRILVTALDLVDRHGMDALSMRRLASELGVDPMALYHHLPSKSAVVAGLVERVFGEFHVPSPQNATWQDRVHAVAAAYRDLVRSHPNLVLYLTTDREASARGALEGSEALYAALAAAGLPPRQILLAADVVVDFVNGYVLSDAAGHIGESGERAALVARLNESPVDQFPTIRRVVESLTEEELRGDFHAGLGIILAGIQAMQQGSAGQL
jgi:TetR/AcrR family transcriptional regulator, tetracycline repressor protein